MSWLRPRIHVVTSKGKDKAKDITISSVDVEGQVIVFLSSVVHHTAIRV